MLLADVQRTFPDEPCGDATDVLLGADVGGYELLELLGQGPLGRVYRARQALGDRQVALKVYRGDLGVDDDQALERLFEGAHRLQELTHPNLAPTVELSFDPELGRLVGVMPLLHGQGLRELVRRGPLAPARAAAIAEQLAEVLAHAHRAGLSHRALKPENVFLLRADDGGDAVRLLDLGVAELLEETSPPGVAPGEPAYLAPEQIHGIAVDERVDLYGLGLLLYEMLAGRPPFDGETAAALIARQLHAAPPPLPANAGAGAIPRSLALVVERCLAKSPQGRPASAELLRVEISLALEDTPTGRTRPPSAEPTRRAPTPVRNPFTERATTAAASGGVEPAASSHGPVGVRVPTPSGSARVLLTPGAILRVEPAGVSRPHVAAAPRRASLPPAETRVDVEAVARPAPRSRSRPLRPMPEIPSAVEVANGFRVLTPARSAQRPATHVRTAVVDCPRIGTRTYGLVIALAIALGAGTALVTRAATRGGFSLSPRAAAAQASAPLAQR